MSHPNISNCNTKTKIRKFPVFDDDKQLSDFLSKNKVGKIHSELAQKEEVNINSQNIDDDYEYLLVDGIWQKTKGYGWENNKAVLLCILGIKPNGERKIIGFKFARTSRL